MPAPLSIIIPAFNAAADLPLCLSSLMPGVERGVVRELILVDGGSTDDTARIADDAGATVLHAPEKGRAKQLIHGAAAAQGDWLLFLHADTALDRDWATASAAHIAASPDMAAAFTLKFRSDDRAARTLARRANWRARTFGLPYGDQGLLISRALYDALGGYPDIRLMEDVKLMQAIGKKRLKILPEKAHTSAAKYQRDGWRKRSWHNAFLLTRYLLGASPEKLADLYD